MNKNKARHINYHNDRPTRNLFNIYRKLIQAIYLYNTNYTIHLQLINQFQFLLKNKQGEATQKIFPFLDLFKTTNQHEIYSIFTES